MFAEFKQIFNPKNKDLRKRILFTFVALFIFKLGTTIIVPGIDADSLGTNNLGFLELMNVMGGGALEQFSIFALGVMPYITASIIMQLLQADIIPYFAELAKQGGTGRAKLNQITRYMGIALAFIQGYIFSFAFVANGTPIEYLTFALILTAGTSLLLWIGDQITAKGVGNGISLIIMAGIIATLPNMFYQAWTGLVDVATTQTMLFGIVKFALFLLVYILIIVGVVYIECSERRIPIQYANKSTADLGKQTFMPIKINSAGVIPVIFASSLLSIFSTIAMFVKNDGFQNFVSNYLDYSKPVGFTLFIILIFGFAYFYTFVQMKPEQMAKNLQDNGGYIPGVRPGESTEKYFINVLSRLTVVGALFLSVIAGLPILVNVFTNLPSSVQLGGTGLLIVVGVAIETYKQLDSSLLSREYGEVKTSSRRRRR